jgi:CheY-like chemotaxis protein
MIRLLYIDDDDIDRMALSRLLRKFEEIELTAVSTIDEARQVLQKKDDFDLIITDYHFGIVRLEEFAHEFGQKPFFVLSGKEDIEDELGLRQAGMIKSYRKPISLEQIRQIIDWFSGDSETSEVVPEPFGDSYLDHLTDGDNEFKRNLLTKLSDELGLVISQLKVFEKQQDVNEFLLLVHQLKYKTTLLDAEHSLAICREAEKHFRDNPGAGDVQKYIAAISAEVKEMKTFCDKMLAQQA